MEHGASSGMQNQKSVDLSRADQLHRPPYNKDLRTTTNSLIVTPTLVSRVDDTAWSKRPHDSGSSVDNKGHEVKDPDKHSDRLALESDPNLAFERWDEYWRKIHGPKFAYEEPGSSSHLVMRYDQLHRLPSGPSSYFRPPYRANVDFLGRLDSKPQEHVPAYARPLWDGLAYIAYEEKDDIKTTLEKQEQYSKRIIADERVAFRVVTREICKEFIIIPSPQHRDAISLVKIHKRGAKISRQKFQEKMLGEIADIVLGRTATHIHVKRYVQLHNIGSTQSDPEGSSIDSISILGFASVNDVEDYLISQDYASIEEAENTISGEGCEFWTAVNYSVINRLVPELATARNQKSQLML